GLANCLFFGLHDFYWKHRPKSLIGHHFHRIVNVDQNGRLEEVASEIGTLSATREYPSALCYGVGNVINHHPQLTLIDQRPNIRRAIGPWCTHSKLLHLLDNRGYEFLRDRLHHVKTLDRSADLSAVHKRAPHGAFYRPFERCVFAHDHRIFAAELENDWQQPLCRRLGNPLARSDRTREENLVDFRFDERSSGTAVTLHDFKNAFWNSGRGKKALDSVTDQRSVFRRFEHHGVTGHQCHHNLAHRYRERKIPRADDSHNAERLVNQHRALVSHHCQRELLRLEDALCISGEVAHQIAHHEHFSGESFKGRLARFVGDYADNLFFSVEQFAMYPQNTARSIIETQRSPRGLRSSCPVYCSVHLGGGGDMEPRDLFERGGIQRYDFGTVLIDGLRTRSHGRSPGDAGVRR